MKINESKLAIFVGQNGAIKVYENGKLLVNAPVSDAGTRQSIIGSIIGKLKALASENNGA